MTTRRLAAILAADVVGFSSMMERDEEGTLRLLKATQRDLIEPRVREHHGRIVKTTGDGFLIEFGSPLDAVRCALEVQEATSANGSSGGSEETLRFRIGINLGDIIIEEDGDIYGDGVNVATRLEQIAGPGTICISGKVFDEVEGKLPEKFAFTGEQQVKNLTRPVRVYSSMRGTELKPEPKPFPVPDKPSIAVLAFTNMSGDPDQEYFADGVVEDIITALSRFKWLAVIARNSSFTYKGRAVDVKQVGRGLGVRYVLEGSIRKAGTRLRISGQLIEASSGRHIWAERYDRDLSDVFALQDELTQSVVAAIEPNLRSAEIQRSRGKPTDNLDAYDLYLRALEERYRADDPGFRNAERLLLRATKIDPNFSDAWAALADCIARHYNVAGPNNIDLVTERACEAARRAMTTDPDNGIAFAAAAWCFAIVAGQHSEAVEFADRAIRLNPNSSFVHTRCGWALVHCAEPELAIVSLDTALGLSPVDPEGFLPLVGKSAALLFMHRYEEAVDVARRAFRLQPSHPIVLRYLAASLALSGRMAEAREAADALSRAGISRSFVRKNARRFRHQWMLDLYIEGLSLAGLPE